MEQALGSCADVTTGQLLPPADLAGLSTKRVQEFGVPGCAHSALHTPYCWGAGRYTHICCISGRGAVQTPCRKS